MSKSLFRRPDSSSSESSEGEEEDDEQNSLTQSLAQLDVSRQSASSESITIDRDDSGSLRRDFLIHALLEERCLNQVRRELGESSGMDENAIHQEAQRRYRILCQQLAPLNLFSSGLESNAHSANRQLVRDGLDTLLQTGNAHASQALQRGSRTPVPPPIRRYLTDGDASPLSPNGILSPTSFFNSSPRVCQPHSPTRYQRDFKQIALLGKGGYGEVYQALHHVDQQLYAVKRVPIRGAMIQRIQTEDDPEAAMNEILKEVRSLSRLSHPNIVRYNNSWIEWSNTSVDAMVASSNLENTPDAVFDAERSLSFEMDSLRRVRTETDTDDIGISFESRSRADESHSDLNLLQDVNSHANDTSISGLDSTSASENGKQVALPGPTLTLYLQMAVYPMTLADFISPKKASDIQPLAHCFHLEPSIRILLAILEGVEYMHSQNVVHRDVKPANVFLKIEEHPKANPNCVDLSSCADCQAEKRAITANLGVCIGDFGLVTNIAKADDPNSSPAAVGTEIYRPTTNTSNINPRLDIFACGIIACELLCKFDTQMERRQTLQDLKHGKFPKNWPHSSRLKDCIHSMLVEDVASIADLKRTLSSMLARKEMLQDMDRKEEATRRSST